MKRIFVAGLMMASLFSFAVDVSYGDLYVICYRYGKGRCMKCTETLVSGPPQHYNHRELCHGVGKTFNSSEEAERWRALYCTCPGSK
jgi:hypothetical protein